MDILNFIALIRNSCPGLQRKIFTEGACFTFFEILRAKYYKAQPYYNGDHVITKLGNKFYDITGEVELGDHELMKSSPTKWGLVYTEKK